MRYVVFAGFSLGEDESDSAILTCLFSRVSLAKNIVFRGVSVAQASDFGRNGISLFMALNVSKRFSGAAATTIINHRQFSTEAR